MDQGAAIAAAALAAAPFIIKNRPFLPGRTVLIDGDYLVYTTAGNDETPIGDARRRLMQKISDFKDMSGCEHVVLHLTATGGHKGYRYIIAKETPYQGQREGSRRPKNWALMRDFVESYKGPAFKQKIWGSREADDGINYHLLVLLAMGREATVAMKDKDSQMFTGCTHMDWNTYELTQVPLHTYEMENSVGLIYGHKWFWLQMLMGDDADKIPGVKLIRSGVSGKLIKCGPGRAKDVLCMSTDNVDAQMTVVKCYIQSYQERWADVFVEQAALLWMREDKNGEVLDFLRIMQPEGFGYEEIRAAALRLDARVRKEVADAEAFS